MKKAAGVFRVFSVVILIAAVIFAVSFVAVLLLGMRLYCVRTGSMEPTYPVGALIVVEPTVPENLAVGDVITFVVNEGTTVTHRIVEADRENRLFRTKGDNNNTADTGGVAYENVIGKVRGGVPLLGYPVLAAQTKFGRIMIGALVLVVIVGDVLVAWIEKEDPEKTDEVPES